MFEYGRKLAAQRRKAPGNDIITQLAFEPLTQREFDVYFVLLATAGNETTRHTITHGLLALCEHPDQLERLRDDPELSSRRPRRCCAGRRRCTTSGARPRRDRAGRHGDPPADKVTTWFVSGNRDETVFDDPDSFDVGRKPNPHMAFGPGGIHYCMGAHLARMEIRIAFEELLQRVTSIELTGRPSGCARTSSTASSASRCG